VLLIPRTPTLHCGPGQRCHSDTSPACNICGIRHDIYPFPILSAVNILRSRATILIIYCITLLSDRPAKHDAKLRIHVNSQLTSLPAAHTSPATPNGTSNTQTMISHTILRALRRLCSSRSFRCKSSSRGSEWSSGRCGGMTMACGRLKWWMVMWRMAGEAVV
jgi:hypothetical protein